MNSSDKPKNPEEMRYKIEQALAGGTPSSPRGEQNIKELVQKLSIYYQEMEFQNDELRRIQGSLEESQNRYRELYENAPMAFASYTSDLTIQTANRTFATLVGVDKPEGHSFAEFIHASSQDQLYLHVRQVLQDETASSGTLMLTSRGIRVRIESNALRSDGQQLVRSSLIDISAEYRMSTQLVEANRELKLFKDRLNGSMLAGNVAWWQLDLRTGAVTFSDNKARMLGFPPDHFKHYEDFTNLLHPEDVDTAMEAMRACMRGERDYAVDYRIQAATGVYRWFSDTGTVTERAEDGQALVVSGVVTDVTERLRNQHLAEDNERKLRLLFDFIPIGLTIADKNGNILNANKAAGKLLGLSSHEQSERAIDGNEWRIIRRDGTLMPSDEYASVRALQEGTLIQNVEMGIPRRDGTTSWIVTSAAPTGIPGFDLVIAYQDISTLVRKEDELFRNEQMLQLYLEKMPQPMLLTDAKGTILRINRAITSLYGYSAEELVGENPRVLNPGLQVYRELGYSAEDYEELFSSLWCDIQDAQKGGWQGTLVNRKKDGNLVWAGLQIRTIFDANGQITNYIGLPNDITSYINRAKESRIEMYRTIASLSELRDNETGNHMRRVGIFARLIARELGLPAKYCEDIELFAPMHDIGKVGIPDSLLLAPRKLTAMEFDHMKRHTELGHAIVAGKPEMDIAADITLYHHEWWNGSGYPQGLSGSDIPLAARITTIADVYDALRSHRPYKNPWSHEEAMAEITGKDGTQFDPSIIASLLRVAKSFEDVYRELED